MRSGPIHPVLHISRKNSSISICRIMENMQITSKKDISLNQPVRLQTNGTFNLDEKKFSEPRHIKTVIKLSLT